MSEPLNDYAEPIIQAKKNIARIEHLLRLRRLEEAMELIPSVETQCIKLRNYIYRGNENGKD